ncbi:MAG: DUF5696 domain-containing protein [Defluviitaleaceae bacterium]|nr:DUF5696 domain-containing protein [Defluviitaleaceae bacterium]
MAKSTKRFVRFFLVVIIIAIFVYLFSFNKMAYDYAHLFPDTYEAGWDFEPLPNPNPMVSGMVLAAETDELKLYVNTSTGEIAVYDKRGGHTWYSNPPGRRQDPIANQFEISHMSSQLAVTFFNSQRRQMAFNSHDHSTDLGQLEIEAITNGVRMNYTIGDLTLGVDLLPQFITDERLYYLFLQHLDAGDADWLLQRYRPSAVLDGFRELSSIDRAARITSNRLMGIFEYHGYDVYELAYDNMLAGVEMELDRIFFEISIEYRLEGDTLVATVPMDRITENGGGELGTVTLLQFFGAGGTQDEGYMLVPSGAGGLIHFNNGRIRDDQFVQPVYGFPPMTQFVRTQINEPVRFPIFGVSRVGGGAFIACVVEGEPLASIFADISGKTGSYNHVFSVFTLRNSGQLPMTGAIGSIADMTVLEEFAGVGNYTIRFMFLPGNDDGYPEMANRFREELITNGALTPLDPSEGVPFYLDIYGGVEQVGHVLGVPFTSPTVLTTYSQAMHIVNVLSDLGVENIHMRFLGWHNGGVNHASARNINRIRSLGNFNEMRELDSLLQQGGGALFPDVQFQRVSFYNTRGYRPNWEASRDVTGFLGVSMPFGRITMRRNTNYRTAVFYYNSPNALPSHVDSFIDAYSHVGLSSLALRDLGDIVTADFDRASYVSRAAAVRIMEEQLGKIAESYNNLMISGGNMYALRYANHIINLPTSANMFYIIDEEVPFLPMVLHGYVNFTGHAFNTSQVFDPETQRLRMIEFGGAPYFVMTYAPTEILRFSYFENLFTTHYVNWVTQAAEDFALYQEVFSGLRSARMINHINHGGGVFETRYSNSTSIFVNYGRSDAYVNGVLVRAMDFAVGSFES